MFYHRFQTYLVSLNIAAIIVLCALKSIVFPPHTESWNRRWSPRPPLRSVLCSPFSIKRKEGLAWYRSKVKHHLPLYSFYARHDQSVTSQMSTFPFFVSYLPWSLINQYCWLTTVTIHEGNFFVINLLHFDQCSYLSSKRIRSWSSGSADNQRSFSESTLLTHPCRSWLDTASQRRTHSEIKSTQNQKARSQDDYVNWSIVTLISLDEDELKALVVVAIIVHSSTPFFAFCALKSKLTVEF